MAPAALKYLMKGQYERNLADALIFLFVCERR